MTVEELRTLPNGANLYFNGDEITVFTKIQEGIACNYRGDVRIMPMNVAEIVIDCWRKDK